MSADQKVLIATLWQRCWRLPRAVRVEVKIREI
jgi:hypothetical protein